MTHFEKFNTSEPVEITDQRVLNDNFLSSDAFGNSEDGKHHVLHGAGLVI